MYQDQTGRPLPFNDIALQRHATAPFLINRSSIPRKSHICASIFDSHAKSLIILMTFKSE
jgi:hypothetical protein